MTRLIIIICSLVLFSCKYDKKVAEPEIVASSPKLKIPVLNKDSAYAYVAKQVSFGPRVPGTAAHKLCGEWIIEKANSFGAKVITQDFSAEAFNGTKFQAKNIIAAYNPAAKSRVILAAHWDSRIAADHDPDKSKQNQQVMGADDGASGVGILLEIARQLQLNPISNLGVDIIFFDAEDQGSEGGDGTDWCLGAQYWARNKHAPNYQAKYGILLDMVGAKVPRYTKEGSSVSYAGAVLDKVWNLAQKMGHGNSFVNENSPPLVDDHYFINKVAGIPMIDIINRPTNDHFVAHWHTVNDQLANIEPETLKFTGQVVLAVIYREANGEF